MIKINIAVLLLILTGASCTKEEIIARSYPRVNTIGITNINDKGALLRGEIFYTDVPIRDHGFLWAPYSNTTFANSDRVSLGPKDGVGPFEATAAWGLVKGKTYYMRAYAISDDNVVFGDIENFVSKGTLEPVITDLYPTRVTWGDTVTLIGNNFSALTSTNTVSINGVNVDIVSGNPDTLRIKVFYSLMKEFSDVAITRSGVTTKAPKQIQLKGPEIQSVFPTSGTEGTDVTISGLYLATSQAKVYFNNIPAPLTDLKANGVVLKVPVGLPPGDVEVKVVIGESGLYDVSTFKVL